MNKKSDTFKKPETMTLRKLIKGNYTEEEMKIYEKEQNDIKEKRKEYPLEVQDQPFCPISKKTCSHYCKAHYFNIDDKQKLKLHRCKIFDLIKDLSQFDVSYISYSIDQLGRVLDKKHEYFPDQEGNYF